MATVADAGAGGGWQRSRGDVRRAVATLRLGVTVATIDTAGGGGTYRGRQRGWLLWLPMLEMVVPAVVANVEAESCRDY